MCCDGPKIFYHIVLDCYYTICYICIVSFLLITHTSALSHGIPFAQAHKTGKHSISSQNNTDTSLHYTGTGNHKSPKSMRESKVSQESKAHRTIFECVQESREEFSNGMAVSPVLKTDNKKDGK